MAVLRVILAAVALFAALPAAATDTQTDTLLSRISSRAVEAKYGRADPAWRDLSRSVHNGWLAPNNKPIGTALVVATQPGPSPKVGEVIDIKTTRVLPWSKITKAVAKSLPLISTAIALKEIADAIRCREAFGGGGECDPGQPEHTEDVDCFKAASAYRSSQATPCSSSASAAVEALVGFLNDSNYGDSPGGCFPFNRVYRSAGSTATTYSLEYQQVYPGACGNNASALPWTSMGSGSIVKTTVQGTQCPSIVVNGVTLVPVKGPDGKCATNVYEPASEQTIAEKGEQWGDKTKAPLIVEDLINNGKPVEHDPPEIDPVPDSVVGGRETTNHPDGSTTTKDTVWDLAPNATGYEWTPRVITKTYPPGATIPPPGEVPGEGGTTTTGGTPEEQQITCGLPNTPPCKIDETGTPTEGLPDPSTAVEGAKAGIVACITDPASCFPTMPSLSWDFALPTACGPIPTPAFAPALSSIDICVFQPIFHDIMSMVWVLGGLFGAISIFWRKTFAA